MQCVHAATGYCNMQAAARHAPQCRTAVCKYCLDSLLITAVTIALLTSASPAGASAKAASAASRAACFMRPCSEVRARPPAAGRRWSTVTEEVDAGAC